MTQEQIDIIESVNSLAVNFTNYLTDINKDYDLDMWDELLDYFKEKRDCDTNYTLKKILKNKSV